jgi:hypothetical protein
MERIKVFINCRMILKISKLNPIIFRIEINGNGVKNASGAMCDDGSNKKMED